MNATTLRWHRYGRRVPWSARAGLATAMMLVGASTAFAQGAAVDARWRAWLGCWTPDRAVDHSALGGTTLSPAAEVCVTPATGSAIVITTTLDHRVVDSTLIDADGAQHPVSRSGCTGWQSAEWAATGSRVYQRSEVTCADGTKRSASGVIAMSRLGEWIDVEGATAGRYSGVEVVRYSPASDAASEAARRGTTSWAGSAWMAEAPVTTTDIIEASRLVDAPVVQAWLVQLDQAFAVNAKQLTLLADHGVPAQVVDLVVALAYPQRFSVNRATDLPKVSTLEDTVTVSSSGQYADDEWMYGDFLYGYSPFGYSPYGYSPYGYSPYGNSPFGLPRGNPTYGHVYPVGVGGSPVVVVAKPPAHVVNGRGYTQGSGGTAGSGASSAPASAPAASSSPPASSSSGSSAPAAAPARTAIPRGGGG